MTTDLEVHTVAVNAGAAARAWLNAFLATSDDDTRPALYRTLSVEFFESGAQFISCDGCMLFRTWVAVDGAPMPLAEEAPFASVVVMDRERFAVGFIRTMLAASKDNELERLTLSIEPAPERADGDMLGDEFSSEVLTLRAFGQRLNCTLYESAYPDWRRLQFGLSPAELVDGMKLSVRMFAAVGKLRGMLGIECDFGGAERAIEIHGVGDRAEVRGLLMPMRREKESAAVINEEE